MGEVGPIPLRGLPCQHCIPGPDGKPVSVDPGSVCSHVTLGTYDTPGTLAPSDPLPQFVSREYMDARLAEVHDRIGELRALEAAERQRAERQRAERERAAEQQRAAEPSTVFGVALREGEPCWYRTGDTMPWMPGVFEGVDDETGDAVVLALESNLNTKRYRFGPRLRPVRAAAAPPLMRQDEADQRLADQRLRFEALVVAAKALLANAEPRGERFTMARTENVTALREALAGAGHR